MAFAAARKLKLLLPIGLLLVLESAADLGYLVGVHLRIITCCTSVFDIPRSNVPELVISNIWTWVIVFYGVTLVLIALLGYIYRANKRGHSVPKAVTSILFLLAPAVLITFLLALHTKISPLFLDTPLHHCIFCLWQNAWDASLSTALVLGGTWLALLYPAIISLMKVPEVAATAKGYSTRLPLLALIFLITAATLMGGHILILTL
jgi:hypothetical protein